MFAGDTRMLRTASAYVRPLRRAVLDPGGLESGDLIFALMVEYRLGSESSLVLWA